MDRYLEIRKLFLPDFKQTKAALLIIDMQEYQVRKGWALYRTLNDVEPGLLDHFIDRIQKVVEPNITRLVRHFRQHRMKVIYTMFSSVNQEGRDLPKYLMELYLLVKEVTGEDLIPHQNSPGSQIIDSLQPHKDDLIIVKKTASVFTSTNLDLHLKNMGIEHLFVVGVVTNMCVEGSARSAAELGYDVVIIDDACAAWNLEVHKSSLKSFELIFGHVMMTDEVIDRLPP